MTYEPTTNFRGSDGVDLGKKLITKDYLLEVYGSILDSLVPGLTVTPAVWTWGDNTNGQLGVNDTNNRTTPVTTFSGGTNWKQVSSGGSYTAAIKTDGTLWTWGLATFGRIGTNDSTDRTVSTPVTTFAGGNNWKSVSCGYRHTAAIKTDGTLWTWGRNGNGQLGISGPIVGSDKRTPVTTFLGGTDWKSVASGAEHTAAIKTDGTLWIWGANNFGQLGINNTDNRSIPVTTFTGGNNWKHVDCGDFYTAAIKTDGTLWTWGRNNSVQLGVNDTDNRSIPVTTFLGGNNWKSVSCGTLHTLAIKTDGTLWIWGNNSYGQLGINNTDNRFTPVTTFLGGINWKSVSGGGYHTVAIKTDGTLWTWGRNDSGQLGVNDTANISIPVTTFLGGNNWKQVSSGFNHTTAIQSVDYI